MLKERKDTEGKQRTIKCINNNCDRWFHLACVLQDPESTQVAVTDREIAEWECMYCYLLRMDQTRIVERILVPPFIS